MVHRDIRIKRAYEPPAPEDGSRVLVDRLWPRGVTKQAARIDDWPKEITPSTELRKEFSHMPERWAEFKARYAQELEGQAEALDRLCRRAEEGPVTLVFAARDERYNNAVALKEILEQR